MSDVHQDLMAFLAEFGISAIGEIVADNDQPERLFVRIAIIRDKNNHQQPSNRVLADAKARFAAEGRHIEFLLNDERGQDIEAGLRATLLYSFPSYVRNAFLSVDGRRARVWVDPKLTLGEGKTNELAARAAKYLKSVGVELQSLIATGEENLPGSFACLRQLRQIAPASVAELMAKLQENFTVPSEDWLRRRLDTLRKADKVVWIQGDRYACTLGALRALGSARGRSSPDVSRLLALTRRSL